MKRKLGLGEYILTLTILCPITAALGYAGAMCVDDMIQDHYAQVDRKNFGDMYDLMLKNSNGRVVTLEKFKEPITVRLAQNFSEKEKAQLVDAIQTLDDISPNLNYTLLKDDDYTVSTNIYVQKGGDCLGEMALATTEMKYNSRAKIVYPISINFEKEFSDYFANVDISESDLLSHVMKHELMHTLGFADLYTPEHFDKSIMWYTIDNAVAVDDYTERDKKCINKIYDDMLVTVKHPSQMRFNVSGVKLYKEQDDELVL